MLNTTFQMLFSDAAAAELKKKRETNNIKN